MDSVRLSQQLQNFLRKEVAELVVGCDSVARLLETLGKFLYGLSMPSYWRLTEIERGEQCWHFRWRSQSDQAACPVCHTVSQHSAKLYTEHTVQDFPLAGKAVYHTVTSTRYVCDQSDGLVYTFVEPMEDFAGPGARLSNRLKTFLIRLYSLRVEHQCFAAVAGDHRHCGQPRHPAPLGESQGRDRDRAKAAAAGGESACRG